MPTEGYSRTVGSKKLFQAAEWLGFSIWGGGWGWGVIAGEGLLAWPFSKDSEQLPRLQVSPDSGQC